ncbi:MAG: acetyltransferase [Proteobacteria bacterium]|nr:acetyltransferase [Pseudomonadota bacterium]MBU1709136.1 acetyltransferase [Pseudomonadota bacterium]
MAAVQQHYDVFNGDADGICALHQLRLDDPKPAQLITGVKRDIKLLRHLVGVQNAVLTVFDISLDSNREYLDDLLETCTINYYDHHYAGQIPDSGNLISHIDPGADVCTSMIVDRRLKGKHRGWAVAAAFGDNLHESAAALAQGFCSEEQLAVLREIGELMNYNGYGSSMEDLHFTPIELYEALKPYEDPLEFYDKSQVFAVLRDGFHGDMRSARSHDPIHVSLGGRVFRFPCESWARRTAGVFSNEKAREKPDLAHALIVDNPDGTFLISVRAPLQNKQGADILCRAFPTGGGRSAAAGLNALPPEMLGDFIHSFDEVFAG